MNLEAALNTFRAEFLEKFPAVKAAIMQGATNAITQDFKSKPLLQVGDLAPDFTLSNAIGTDLRLSDRLSQAPQYSLSPRSSPSLSSTGCTV